MDADFDLARTHFIEGLRAFEAGAWADAEALFMASLERLPGRPSTLMNLAAARTRLGRPADALACLATLLALSPDDGEALFHQGQTLQALGRPAEALRSYDRVLALDDSVAAAWSQRGGVLKDMGRLPEAASSFRHALAHGGDAELNGYFLASVAGGAVPVAAPRAYVEGLFDSYAADFDEHLAKLGYRTPQHLVALLPSGRRFASALDLGCGTGLMAPLLQPACAAIDGVDLSSLMLAKARAAGRYRALHHADVAEHLQTTNAQHELMVAADVFIYVGALEAVFAGVARVLQPGGCFLFSLEAADPGERLQLRASSRYAHSEDCVRTLAAGNGLHVQQVVPQTLRHEQNRPIGGLLVLMARDR